MKLSKRTKKIMIAAVSVIVLAFLCSLTAFADGEVAGAVESTWNAAKGQIKTIVNNVVFPVVDVILAILLFVKIATSYMDYRKHGHSGNDGSGASGYCGWSYRDGYSDWCARTSCAFHLLYDPEG